MRRLRFIVFGLLVALSPAATSTQAWAQDKETRRAKAADDDGEDAESEGEGAEGEEAGAADATSGSSFQRGQRMEFDARLIRGERASGAVFLFQRATRPLPSMVKRRTSYLDETVAKSLGENSAEEFRKNQSEAIEKRIRAEEEERRKAREASLQKAEKLEKEKAEREKAEKEEAAKDKADKADKK